MRVYGVKALRVGSGHYCGGKRKSPAQPKLCGAWAKNSLAVVSSLAVRRNVQTFALVFFAHTQADRQIHQLERDD